MYIHHKNAPNHTFKIMLRHTVQVFSRLWKLWSLNKQKGGVEGGN